MRKIFPSLIREGGYWQNGVELWSFIHSAVEEARRESRKHNVTCPKCHYTATYTFPEKLLDTKK